MELPDSWDVLRGETDQEYFHQLREFVIEERKRYAVYPSEENVFAALQATPLEDVKVLLLGQDPYHGQEQAHGLCFSVLPGTKIPPSLRNIFKELAADQGCGIPESGCLVKWAGQGVLMLNTVLTVRSQHANSHRKQGWEQFTDAVIKAVNAKQQRVAFVLWGNPAQKKKRYIDGDRHLIIESPHPSPLSAHRGFFGSRPFSRVNAALIQSRRSPIDWALD